MSTGKYIAGAIAGLALCTMAVGISEQGLKWGLGNPAHAKGEYQYNAGFTLYTGPTTDPKASEQDITQYTRIIQDSQTGEQYLWFQFPGQAPVIVHRVGAQNPPQLNQAYDTIQTNPPRTCRERLGFLCIVDY